MDEELRAFINGKILIDMDGTTEDDWRQILADCERLGFDLDEAAQEWWGHDLIKEMPFVEYEQQNIKGPHKNGGWQLQFRYLNRTSSAINSVRNPTLEEKHSVSYLELKERENPLPEFTLNF